MHEIMENRWDDGLVLDLKVETSLLSQTKKLLKNRPGSSLEDRVNTGVDHSCMALSVLLSNQNLVLNVEVRDVVFEVDIL